MIVECDRCSTRYRVRDDKLPETGGNIKCPSCAHVFFVKPDAASPGLRPAPSGLRKATGGVSDDMPTRIGTAPSALLGNTGAFQAIGAPPAKAPEPAPAVDQGPPADASWKLKTSFGLVYDFPDTSSLRSWLSARDALEGYQLSYDGQNFQDLSAFPDIVDGSKVGPGGKKPTPPSRPALTGPLDPTVRPSGEQEVVPRTTSPTPRPQKRTPPPPQRRARPLPPPDSDEGSSKTIIGLAVAGLVAVVLVIGLQVSGAVDFKAMMPKPEDPGAKAGGKKVALTEKVVPETDPNKNNEPNPFDKRANRANADKNGGGAVVRPFGHDDHVKTMLDQAQQEMRRQKYEEAVQTLESAAGVAPNNPQIYQQLERAYNRVGKRDKARQARETYRQLQKRNNGAP